MTDAPSTAEPDAGQERPAPQPGVGTPAPRGKRSILGIALWVGLLSGLALLLWGWGSQGFSGQIGRGAALAETPQTETSTPDIGSWLGLPDFLPTLPAGLFRRAQMHTILPLRPRFEMTQYTVQQGDTIFGIAEKVSLKPQSIMWGNSETLGDDPDMISPGVTLTILPEDGATYRWTKGDGLKKVSEYFHVTPQDIIDWPGNRLTLESVGDFTNPNITAGTLLFIPGGVREFVSKVGNIPRKSPGVASYLGPGVCSAVSGGAMGTGSFVWPAQGTITTQFTPEIGHPAIDIAAPLGTAIAAVDTGVVVYAGPTYDNIGYGNLVIIDHGNGWQTLYAHLSAIYVSCGSGIFQGAAIGAMGSTGRSTGPHLHFQMESTQYGKVNPLNYLP